MGHRWGAAMASISESQQAQASVTSRGGGRGNGYAVSPPGTQESMRRSEVPGLSINLPRHSHNPYSDNPHAATGNYSLNDGEAINPTRPVTSMLPPLEKTLLLRTAEERAAKRERKEVVRKMNYAPGGRLPRPAGQRGALPTPLDAMATMRGGSVFTNS